MADRNELKKVDSAFAYNSEVNFLTIHLADYLIEMDSYLSKIVEMLSDAGVDGINHFDHSEDIQYSCEMFGELLVYSGNTAFMAMELIDKPLYKNFNLGATESLSRIKIEDYSVENNLDIKRIAHTRYGTYDAYKQTLNIEDFLGLTLPEQGGTLTNIPEEFRQFTDIYAEYYDSLKDSLLDEDGNPISLEEYLEELEKSGEFSHSMNQPFKSFLNALTDITIIIPIIEACRGEELITGEDLSDFERGLKVVGAAVSVFSLGTSAVYMNAAGYTTKQIIICSGKAILIDAASTTTSYWTGYACNELGLPAPVTYVLAFGAGSFTSSSLNELLLGGQINHVPSSEDVDIQKPIDTPLDTTMEKPLQTPVETPVETPLQTPIETPDINDVDVRKPYATSRPSYAPDQVEQVWLNAMDPETGKVYDPSGVEITWDRTKPRNGQWDMGHIPGEKYSEVHQLYMDGIMSKEEFLAWYRNPANYRPELPSTNRSHLYE